MEEGDKGAWMFTVEQEIPNPAKLTANKNYLQSKSDVAQQRRAIQYNTLRSEAKTYYYRWLVAEEKLEVLKENERIMDLMLKLARIRYPYNQGSLGNIYKAEGRLSEVRNMMLMTRSDIAESSYRLKSLANIAASDSLMIDTTITVGFRADQIMYDTAALVDLRSDIKEIDETIEVMRLNQRLQQVQSKPDFKIKFDHMQPIGNMPSQFSAMAMISIPIAPWSSKMYKAEVKGMQYEIQAMQKGREAILIETRGWDACRNGSTDHEHAAAAGKLSVENHSRPSSELSDPHARLRREPGAAPDRDRRMGSPEYVTDGIPR
jgi:outer membrane protein, heavy metal efflux system